MRVSDLKKLLQQFDDHDVVVVAPSDADGFANRLCRVDHGTCDGWEVPPTKYKLCVLTTEDDVINRPDTLRLA